MTAWPEGCHMGELHYNFHMKRFSLLFLASFAFVFGTMSAVASDSPLLAAPKAAPEPDQPDVLVGLRKGGKAKGNDVYSARLTSKQRLTRVPTARGITTYYRIQNDSQGLMAVPYSLFEVKGDKSDSRYDISYFSEKGANVTAKVSRGRYVLNIATDAETSLRQRIFPKGSSTSPGVYGVKAENVDTLAKDTAGVLLRRP